MFVKRQQFLHWQLFHCHQIMQLYWQYTLQAAATSAYLSSPRTVLNDGWHQIHSNSPATDSQPLRVTLPKHWKPSDASLHRWHFLIHLVRNDCIPVSQITPHPYPSSLHENLGPL